MLDRTIKLRLSKVAFAMLFNWWYSPSLPMLEPEITTSRMQSKFDVEGYLDLQDQHPLEVKNDDVVVEEEPAKKIVVAKPRVPQVVQPAPEQLEAWFSQYGAQFGVDPLILREIARCESGFNAASATPKYGGMYQYLSSTWQSTRSAMGADPNPDLRFNGEEAIKTTAWKIAAGGINSWPECSKRALAMQ